MNLANAVTYDPETKERRYTALGPAGHQWLAPLAAAEHFAMLRDSPREVDCSERRAMRGGGREILEALRSAGRLLTEAAIAERIPHAHETTLRVWLCRLTQREDIVRYGERHAHRYGLPGGSTMETT